ncbi:MAG: hypothetical protein ACWA5A_07145 [Marinibacterium sp.]
MALRIFPEPVRQMQASRSMRLRHELWHFVRAVWGNPDFPEQGRQILRDLDWALPEDRAPFAADGTLLLDNFSGEDFLFMHRDMIRMTDMALAAQGEPPISRWSEIPAPGDADFPVPPVWTFADPNRSDEQNQATTQFLTTVKSDAYFETTMRVRASFLSNPSNLGRLSLGALGNLAEMTIHNRMHMRWAADPGGYRPGVNILDPAAGDARWDVVEYDYLGDTYSSHVNPHFWYLHGWIDNLVDAWAAARGLTDIPWTGTWLGGPDLTGDGGGMMAMAHESVPAPRLSQDEVTAKLRDLVGVASGLAVPMTLVDLAEREV